MGETDTPADLPPLAALPASGTSLGTYAYNAQTAEGYRLAGTIESSNADEASRRLESMRLRIVEVQPAEAPRKRAGALRGDDFTAFNQQLAQLTASGMPVEQGLRLIAADLRSGRLARTVRELVGELERGTPLDQAFGKFEGRFPPLYGRLIGAGIKSGNLPGVLLNLGRHLDLVARLKNLLWQTFAYPMFVVLGMIVLVTFLGFAVLPQFEKIYADFHIQLPLITRALLAFGRIAPAILVILLIVIVGGPIVWRLLQWSGRSSAIVERLILPLPLIGPILRNNLLARWCDAARIGVEAGLDLPAALGLAGDAMRSGRLSADGAALVAALAAGQPLTAARTRLLPASVPAALEFASGYHDLGTTLRSLAELYQRQAELRLTALPQVLTPILVLILALFIGFVVFGLLAPLVLLLNQISGPSGSSGGFKL